MKSVLKGAIIAMTGASLGFGVAFVTQIKPASNEVAPIKNTKRSNTDDGEIERKPLTPQQKFLNSLGGTKGFDVDANVDIAINDSLSISLLGNVKGDASNMSDIKIDGSVALGINDTNINANFAYFDSTVFFDFHDSYFKLEVKDITDFIDKLPEAYGLSLDLPSELTSFSLDSFEKGILAMPEKEMEDEGYVYTYSLMDGVNIKWKTNEDDEFLGLKADVNYKGIIVSADVDLKHVDPEELNLVSPAEGENKDKYQDFKPMFTIFDGIYNLTKERTNTINADISLTKGGEDFISTNVDVSYDLDNKIYSLSGDLTTHNKTMPYGFALANKTIYADYSDLHVSIGTDSLSKLISFFSNKLGSSELDGIMDSLTATIENPNIAKIVEIANNTLGSITLTSEELGVGLKPSAISTELADMSDITVTLGFDGDGISSLKVDGLSYKGYEADINLSFVEYKAYQLVSSDYQSLEPLSSIPEMIEQYTTQSKFAIEFDGKYTSNENGVYKELTIGNDKNGNPSFIQFAVDENRHLLDENGNTTDNGYGYGQVTISDFNGYSHNVKVDLKSVDEVLFSYNSTMNGKMKIDTLKDLYKLVKDIAIDNPDDHMKEIMNKIFDSTTSFPIKDIMGGDYTLLLATNIIDRLEVKENYLEADVSLDILSLSGVSFTLRIEYQSGENPCLEALKVSNLVIDGITDNQTFEFNAYLRDYDESKDASSTFRLDKNADYIDFSDIKVLLELGLNTSKFNYYHFSGNAHLNIGINIPLVLPNGINKDVPMDIKVWTRGDENHNSDVEVDVNLTNIPTIVGFNKHAFGVDERSAHIYYHNNMFYVDRIDDGSTKYAGVYTVDYFFENIMQILLKDVMGTVDTTYSLIGNSINNNDDYQIPYEKILKDFKYNASEDNFFFDLDIAALSGNDDLKSLTITARTDEDDTQLVGADVHLGIKVLVTITLDLKIDLVDRAEVADESNRLTYLEAFEEAHKNDTLNKLHKY